ncbi:Uncharacterised protein [Vibrio cholerae]|nr:Uncharacterised protein [Vibrio cholerae]
MSCAWVRCCNVLRFIPKIWPINCKFSCTVRSSYNENFCVI